MIFSLRKWLERAKFVSLFLVFTFLMYHLLQLTTDMIRPRHRFQEPTGSAVKAYAVDRSMIDSAAFGDRLRFFYWYGE